MKLFQMVSAVVLVILSSLPGRALAQGCCTTCIGTSECGMAGGATFTKCQISCVSGEICVCNNVWRQCSSCIIGLSDPREVTERFDEGHAAPPRPLTRVVQSVQTDRHGGMHFSARFLDLRGGPALPYLPEWHQADILAVVNSGTVREDRTPVRAVVDPQSLAQLGSQNPLLARVASLVLKRVQAGEPAPMSILLPASLVHRAFDVDREGPAQWADTPEPQARDITRRRAPETPIGLDIAVRQEAGWLYISTLPRDASTESVLGPAPMMAFHVEQGQWRWSPARSKGLH